MKPKKNKWTVLLPVLVCILVLGTVAVEWLRVKRAPAEQTANYKTETVRRGDVSTGIRESGTVTFGTQEQTFTVAEVTDVSTSDSTDSSSGSSSSGSSSSGGNSRGSESGGNGGGSNMQGGMGMSASSSRGSSSAETTTGEETTLTVEEVYAAAGQSVKKGDPLLKITDESLADYREQLEAAVATAQLLVAKEEINVESKRAEADYNYKMYLAEGEIAEETYQATITSLENAVTELEEELSEADDDDEIEELTAQLKIAQNNLVTKSIEAKQTYEAAITNYKYAQQLYEIETNGLEDDWNAAKETLAEAQQNLADFEEQIGDGIVYAEYEGTITEIAYAAGDTLMSDAALATFNDADNVTITVSVSQEDISQVAVGDAASITLTAYEGEEFPGEVSSITTAQTTGSATVNYDVAVRFTGDIGKVYSGMTGEAVLAGKSVTDTLYIPNQAVSQDGAKSYVKVLDEDGQIRKTEIQTGFSNGSIVAVESGLSEGETVILESRVGE